MKHRLSLVGVLACAACLAAALAGCASSSGYTPETLDPSVSSPTIGEDGTLRVGVGSGAPFVVSGAEGKTSGLDVDMAAAIADELGLKLEVVSLGSGTGDVDVESALKKGDVDIVMGASASDAGSNVWVSDPYTQTGVALFASPGTQAPGRTSSPKIAAQSSSTSAWAVTNAFGDDALVAKSDLLSALSAVETDDAQYVAADAVIGTYAALGQNVDVQPVAVLGSVGGYSVAVASSNADLQKAVSDALAKISGNGVAKVVCTKWLGSALDLSQLPSIEVSSSASSKAKTSGTDAQGGEDGESTSEESAEGAAPKTDAGANAVLPDGSSSTAGTSSSTAQTDAAA